MLVAIYQTRRSHIPDNIVHINYNHSASPQHSGKHWHVIGFHSTLPQHHNGHAHHPQECRGCFVASQNLVSTEWNIQLRWLSTPSLSLSTPHKMATCQDEWSNTTANGYPGLLPQRIIQINHAKDAETSMMWLDTYLIKTDASLRTATLVHRLTTTPLLSMGTRPRLSKQ